jgi:hypothetical protein
MRVAAFVCTFALFFSLGLTAQTAPEQSLGDEGIKVTAFADRSTVPLNRAAVLTIRLEWYGDLDRYEVTDFENPTAQNFEIISNASANKVSAVNGRSVAIQDFQYTLKPVSLGMGYVNGLTIKYKDAATGKAYRLWTNRVEIKILDPVAEPGSYRNLLYLLTGGLVLGLAGYWFWRRTVRKHQERDKAEAVAKQQKSLEEVYLENLKNQIPLQSSDLDPGQALSHLSRMIRRYWAEKFSLPGLEATTEQFIDRLKTAALDERMIREVSEILQTADVVKFSGTNIDRSTLERLYTLYEYHLKSFLNQPQSLPVEVR